MKHTCRDLAASLAWQSRIRWTAFHEVFTTHHSSPSQHAITKTLKRFAILSGRAPPAAAGKAYEDLFFTKNLLREIIMVRDNFLTLPGWFTRDDINDIIFSICVS